MKQPNRDNPAYEVATATASTGFDWESIAEGETAGRETVIRMLSNATGELMQWIYQGGNTRKTGVIVRTYYLLWASRAGALGKMNQTEMAKSLGISKRAFNKAATSFREEFGFTLPGMKGDEAREKYSDKRKKYHEHKRQQRNTGAKTKQTGPSESERISGRNNPITQGGRAQ